MKELTFYRCPKTKNVYELSYLAGEAPVEGVLHANSTDAAGEKHVPVVTVEGNQVRVAVGSVAHPMTEEHLISFVVLQTTKGSHRVELTASDAPEASFVLADGEKAVRAYEYCNLHGLWKTEIA